MLWKKSWWETRWLFLIFLIAMFCGYLGWFGFGYDATKWAASLHRNAVLSDSNRQVLNSYQGYTWAILIKLYFNFLWADWAVFLGAACLATACPWSPSQRAAGLFTFSLPVSRRKVLLSQAAVGYGEMFLIALIPLLFLPLMARFQGRWFSWRDAMLYALLMAFGGAVLFFFSFLLTVILGNWLAAFVIAEAPLLALVVFHILSGTRPWWNILGMMSGESYFYHGQIPWLGLLISLILSTIFLFAAVRIYERRDL
jgi:hypothetical protein